VAEFITILYSLTVNQTSKLDIKEVVQKMTVYAYIRVSDSDKQDSRAQRHAISKYATEEGLLIPAKNFIERNVSGYNTTIEQRGWLDLAGKLNKGDIVLVSDVARISRQKPMAVVGLVQAIIDTGAQIVFCYSRTVIDSSVENEASTMFLLLGEAFGAMKLSEGRAHKATTACEIRSKRGLTNGRAIGAIIKSKLDIHESDIIMELNNGTSQVKVAELFNVALMTLRTWIEKRHQLRALARSHGIEARHLMQIKIELKKLERKNA